MELVITKIESTHNNTKEAIGELITNIISAGDGVTLANDTDYILRTSSVKEIIIKTNNSTYTLERK